MRCTYLKNSVVLWITYANVRHSRFPINPAMFWLPACHSVVEQIALLMRAHICFVRDKCLVWRTSQEELSPHEAAQKHICRAVLAVAVATALVLFYSSASVLPALPAAGTLLAKLGWRSGASQPGLRGWPARSTPLAPLFWRGMPSSLCLCFIPTGVLQGVLTPEL